MIPLSTILSRIRTKYESTSGGSTVRWTDDRLTGLIGEGLECISESTGFYERYCTMPVQPNRTWYDLRGFTPETVVRINSIWSTNRNEFLQPIVEGQLKLQWEDSTGEPQQFFTRGIYWLGVWPKAGDSATGYLRVYFSGIPARFDFPQAVIRDLPDDYLPALEDYVLYEMAGIDREPKKALRYWSSYMEREKSLHDMRDRRLVGSTAGCIGGIQVAR